MAVPHPGTVVAALCAGLAATLLTTAPARAEQRSRTWTGSEAAHASDAAETGLTVACESGLQMLAGTRVVRRPAARPGLPRPAARGLGRQPWHPGLTSRYR